MGEFYQRLDAMAEQGKFLCLGLDPKPGMLPEGFDKYDSYDGYRAFLTGLIDETEDIVAAVKPNKAFYLGLDKELGGRALELFEDVIKYTNQTNPEIITISDSKDADIGSTNEPYAVSAFDLSGADAITTNPYFGYESAEPFTSRSKNGVIPVVRTSNPGAGTVQDLPVRISDLGRQVDSDGESLYTTEQLHVLSRAFEGSNTVPLFGSIALQVKVKWNDNGNCAVVAGATNPNELAQVRAVVGDEIPILIPGVGAQGGDARTAASLGRNCFGRGFLINESRSLMYASRGTDFAKVARENALRSTEAIQQGAAAPATA